MIIKNTYGSCEYDFEVDYVHIYNLYIYPEHRRQGRAKELLKIAIDSIRKTGYPGKIQIVAVPQENSIDVDSLKNFYESMGLEVYECYA